MAQLEAPDILTMPREEVRVRLFALKGKFPFIEIARRTKISHSDLRAFRENRKPRASAVFGPVRLARIAKVCLDIETGKLRWNGKLRGRGFGKGKDRKPMCQVWEAEPDKPATVVHRVMFEGAKPALMRGTAPTNHTMPSFASLFGVKGHALPKTFKLR